MLQKNNNNYDHNNNNENITMKINVNSNNGMDIIATPKNTTDLSSSHNNDNVASAVSSSSSKNTTVKNQKFCEILKRLKNPDDKDVTHISLRNCHITDNDTIELLQNLMDSKNNNSSVRCIDLYQNQIGCRGAIAVSQLLLLQQKQKDEQQQHNFMNKSLNTNLLEISKIWLHRNRIGMKGVKALAKALEWNTSVTRLDLYSNSFDNDGLYALKECLQYNSTIANFGSLILSNNKDGNEIPSLLCQIQSILRHNLRQERHKIVQMNWHKRVFPNLLQRCTIANALPFELQKHIWDITFGDIATITTSYTKKEDEVIHDNDTPKHLPKELQRIYLWHKKGGRVE